MGELNLILGPMYSGKTSTLLSRYLRYKVGNKKCLLIKYKKDDRYSEDKIVTHNLIEESAFSCNLLEECDKLVNQFDVILIDEIQFYDDASIFCDKWANMDKIVEVSGLNGDFKRQPFKQISLLIPLCDSLTHLKAVDRENGKDAPFTARLTAQNKQTLIGGEDLYKAVSRENYIEHVSTLQESLNTL